MKRLKSVIFAELLIIFLAIAICLTVVSKYYFQESLPIIETTECVSMQLHHEEEYMAEVSEENIVTWFMQDSLHDLQLEDTVSVKFQQIKIQQNIYGVLVPYYETEDTYSAKISEIVLNEYSMGNGETEKEYKVKAVLQEKVENISECVVSISYEGQGQDYVLPVDCVIGNFDEEGRIFTIYIVREKLMPWGYTDYVIPVSVEIVERNRQYIALKNYSGEKIVRNANEIQLGKENWVIVRE